LWTEDEELCLINYFSDHITQYTSGVKTKFYEDASTAAEV
jgi:hypothetical protein